MRHIPFACEDDLCSVLARHLDRVVLPSIDPRHIRALAQRPVGAVIPDFIYVHSARLCGDLPLAGLTTFEAAIIATLMKARSLRDVTIARKLYSRLERISPRLRSLERQGILKEGSEGVFALRPSAVPKTAHIVAVEAKLLRWREAVAQAVAYIGFANQAYVALPSEVIRDNMLLHSAAVRNRVGLLAVEPERVSVVLSAPRHETRTADWIWLLSRTVPFFPVATRSS